MFLPFAMFSAISTASARRAFRRGLTTIDQRFARGIATAPRPPLRACSRSAVTGLALIPFPSALVEPSGPEIGLFYTATSGGLYAD
jgi:hypothetical protein